MARYIRANTKEEANQIIERENKKYEIRRVRLASCRFELYPI